MGYFTTVNGKTILMLLRQFHITDRKYGYFEIYTSQWMKNCGVTKWQNLCADRFLIIVHKG
ncbi:hypothetical protein PR048_026621, partial [Dryococelus australis]